MEFNNEEDLENNKEMEENNPNKKKITFMLLPKKDYRVDKEKYSFNNDDFNEKKFYKTSGKGFSFGRGNKKAFTNFDNKNENNYNQKRIRSSTIDKKNLYNSNRIQNVYFNNKENDANMIKMLQKRINEIEKELENNENTFVYNQKIMQKKNRRKRTNHKNIKQKIRRCN
jgi:hypothetical protein